MRLKWTIASFGRLTMCFIEREERDAEREREKVGGNLYDFKGRRKERGLISRPIERTGGDDICIIPLYSRAH